MIRIDIIILLLLSLMTFIQSFVFNHLMIIIFILIHILCGETLLILYAIDLIIVGARCIEELMFIFIVGLCFDH